MSHRSFAIGDLHGDLPALRALLPKLPALDPDDTIVFLGDYVDRGPDSAGVLEFLRFELPRLTPAKIIYLRGNHEEAWLKVVRQQGWAGFTQPHSNGCYQTAESFTRRWSHQPDEDTAFSLVHSGGFYPTWVVHWFAALPYWYEDDHAIYVHAGLPMVDGRWQHPSEVKDRSKLLWERDQRFFTGYLGKKVICGHTVTRTLPQDLSKYTVDDNEDLFWAGRSAYLIDTGAGKPRGFLTAFELPRRQVYESRD
jgi:serine/threonine protein phosphatase 1